MLATDVSQTFLAAGLWQEPALRALLDEERRTGKRVTRREVRCEFAIEAVATGAELRWAEDADWLPASPLYVGRLSACAVSVPAPRITSRTSD
jgi:hypothetical protein